jgi:hypothetical protein
VQLWEDLADRARQGHPDDPSILQSLLNEKDPTCVLLARVASHFKWSEAEMEAVTRGILPIYASSPHGTLDSVIQSRIRLTTDGLLKLGLHNDSPNFAPRVVEIDICSQTPITIAVWSARRQFEEFFGTTYLSKFLIIQSQYNGLQFGHYVSGTDFRNCCHHCRPGEIPVCLELAYDDTQLGGQSGGPLFLGISNLDDAIKGQNRFAALYFSLRR